MVLWFVCYWYLLHSSLHDSCLLFLLKETQNSLFACYVHDFWYQSSFEIIISQATSFHISSFYSFVCERHIISSRIFFLWGGNSSRVLIHICKILSMLLLQHYYFQLITGKEDYKRRAETKVTLFAENVSFLSQSKMTFTEKSKTLLKTDY